MRRLLLLTIAGAALVVTPATANARPAGGGGGVFSCAAFADTTTITMRDNCFAAQTTFVKPGTKITVNNGGETSHTITAVDGTFDSHRIEPGQTFEVPLDHAGVYRYYCSLHGTSEDNGMAGVLIVGKAGASSARTEGVSISEPAVARTPASSADAGLTLGVVAIVVAVLGGALGAVGFVLQLTRPSR